MVASSGADRRRSIAEAALLLMDGGREVPALRDVGAEVGISHAGVLYHFADKHELLVEMLAVSDRDAAREVAERLAEGGLAAVELLSWFGAHLVERPDLGRLFLVTVASQLERGGPPHPYVVERYRVLRGLFADAIRTGQERGEIRPEVDADAKAVEIHAFLDGMALQALVAPGDVDVTASFRSYQARLREELAR